MHAQSKPRPVFEQKLCQDILHQNVHGWININLGVCGSEFGLATATTSGQGVLLVTFPEE